MPMADVQVEQTIGGWRVVATYQDGTAGPVRMIIEPSPDAAASDLTGGISQTVLRKISTTRTDNARDFLMMERLRSEARPREVTPRYLAVLSATYVTLINQGERNPVAVIAEYLDKPANTIRQHVKAARSRGYLVTGSDMARGKAVGALTQRTVDLLGGS
ncbi:hypothetical protein BJF90_26380 [Pseudonocardia sp. CNS-004]|nr:hypothetical protein BJF90_26380 [Pseudonocardia sp. CNS-004]